MELTPDADLMNQSRNEPQENEGSDQAGDLERWGSLITGGALVLLGLKQRSLRGAIMAVAGGSLAYHGATGQKSLHDKISQATESEKSIRVEKTVTILNKSSEELYRFWRNLEILPTFMKHLKSVSVLSDRRSHWVASAPLDQQVEWDAEIVADQQNHLIAWTSVEGSAIDHSGFVRFLPTLSGQGTEVKVVMEYNPPGGTAGATIAKLFGKEPEQQIGDDLSRFKMLMEAGEIATTEGQPSGAR